MYLHKAETKVEIYIDTDICKYLLKDYCILEFFYYRFVASWIDTTRDDESEKAMLTIMFDKYIPSLLESCKKYKRITPLTELQQIQLTCYLLECFLNKSLLPSDCPKEWLVSSLVSILLKHNKF